MKIPTRYAWALPLLALLCLLSAAGCVDDMRASDPPSQRDSSPIEPDAGATNLVVGPNDRFKTIGGAMREAQAGASVIVHAGAYREQVELPQGVTLDAFGDGPVVIDGECARNYGVWIPSGSGSTVRGMNVRNVASAGVMIGNGPDGLPRPDHVTVERNSITDFNCNEEDAQFNAGVAAWNTKCCITVSDNTITYRSQGDVRGKGNGIWFKSNGELPSDGGHVISGNTITGGWDGIGGENEDDAHGTFDRDTLVTGNRVRDCWDDGIQSEGGNEDVRIAENDISGCGSGIAFAPVITGPLYIERNVIHDLEEGLYQNRFCFKVGDGGEGTVFLTENVCSTDGDGIAQTNSGLSPIVSRRNCFRVTRYVMEIGDGDSVDLAGDRFWTTSPDRFIEMNGEKYGSLSDFQAETGQGTGAVESPNCPLQWDISEEKPTAR